MELQKDIEISINKSDLRVLRDGLCVWNTIVLDSLTENGRIKLQRAQDLIEKLWNGCNVENGGGMC